MTVLERHVNLCNSGMNIVGANNHFIKLGFKHVIGLRRESTTIMLLNRYSIKPTHVDFHYTYRSEHSMYSLEKLIFKVDSD